MNRIFITGSEGFFGSNLVEYLLKKKYKIQALVQYNSFQNIGWLSNIPQKFKKNLSIVLGDIRDKELLEKYIKKNDVIINLAALIAIPYSYIAARSYIDNNIIGTLNLLEVARSKKIKKFIQTSTSEIYGSAQSIPMKESHTINPQSPYAASKAACDHLAMSYYYSFNLPVTILRPFNIFGPRQSPRAVIPTIITQAINNKKNIKLGNLNTSRDYTYVLDTANAYEKAINAKNINGEIINIGSGFDMSIKKIAIKILNILNKSNIKIIRDSKRYRPKKSEVQRLCSSNFLAKKILKWQPEFSGRKYFDKGLKKTVQWYLENNKFFKNSKNYKI